jgi:acyl-CoA synthetase (AMP-forming)/AMP-acid ligase II/uncharacterized protein (UPF0332 family)
MTLNNAERQEMSKLYMIKTHEALQDAKNNKNSSPNLSVSRSYYSIFYAAQGLLVLEEVTGLHRHEGVNVRFSELFVKTGEFRKDVFKIMGQIEQDRYKADYNPKITFTAEKAEEHINNAEIFINSVEKMINKRLSNFVNAISSSSSQKITDFLFDNADTHPEKTAIWCDGRRVTYKQFAAMVRQYADFLMDNGVNYLDHIGFPMNNSIESAALLFAAALIGAAIVPINPTIPAHAVITAFKACDVKHLIAGKVFFKHHAENGFDSGSFCIDGTLVCIDGEYEGTLPLSNAVSLLSPAREDIRVTTGEEALVLAMTSGPTREPKPIILTQNNKYIRAIAHIEQYGITKDDCILASTPLYHSLAERLVIMPLMIGATSILMSRFTPHLWLDCVKEHGVTFTIAVSAQLSQIAELLSSPFVPNIESLRCVVSSSALLESHVKRALIDKLNCDFHEIYGTSEISTATDIDCKLVPGKQSVGRPLNNVEIRILDNEGNELKAGEIGEITCRTPLLCDGYYKMPHSYENMICNGYFKTGDLGFLDDDGYLYFSGHKKEIIITGGINVYPNDVEMCISDMQEVSECAVFPYPDDRLGELVAVAIVPLNDSKLTKRMIQIQCAMNLADFQQPKKIFFVNKLPRDETGKFIKSKLLEYVEAYCSEG